ncbi:hypothetical protein SELMODRAFT_407803 [Selaginella moellendorffii]|uniref:Protein kinase domain-containing protein n=1 Tax=Selaginella moellendorffii TaxID=88036 RepID=D8R6T0_SELML|nr:hypothetical protein SELMODRAFT_407803 [Selaginella moellendorffii]
MEVSVDEEQLVQPVKAEAAEKEHWYLFPVTTHGSRLKAWIKAATVGDRGLCEGEGSSLEGVPALLLEDAGQKINRDTMTPEDVFHMTKAIYMVLSHVYGEHGISHNDVAPCNICQDEKGRYRLIDWGLASQLPDIDHPANVLCLLERWHMVQGKVIGGWKAGKPGKDIKEDQNYTCRQAKQCPKQSTKVI